jgi:hypothetical protein
MAKARVTKKKSTGRKATKPKAKAKKPKAKAKATKPKAKAKAPKAKAKAKPKAKAKATKQPRTKQSAPTLAGAAPGSGGDGDGEWAATCAIDGMLVDGVSEREAVRVALAHVKENRSHQVAVVPPPPSGPNLEGLEGSNRWRAKCFTEPRDLVLSGTSSAALSAASDHANSFPTHEIDVWELP